MPERLLAILVVFAPLSLLSIGGGQSIFAEMQRQSVEVQGWLTHGRFVELFALSRAAPGPGSLIAALIGWQAAGLAGALTATLALYGPSALVVLTVGQWWRKGADNPWRRAIERGLAPLAVGLIFAGVVTLLPAAAPFELALLAGSTALLLRDVSPWRVMALAALVAVAWRHALGVS